MPLKHTPAPWEWWTSNSWRRLRHSERGVSTNILYPCVHPDGQADIDVSQFDMDLIAAAPEMLSVLQLIVSTNDEFRDALPEGWDGDPLDDACTVAKAVISKATGATP